MPANDECVISKGTHVTSNSSTNECITHDLSNDKCQTADPYAMNTTDTNESKSDMVTLS